MINRSYLQQVAMIESECQPRKKGQPMIGNFTKSPLRDRQNRMNLGNTPNRGAKTSLSPLRSRRTQSSMVGRVNLSRRRNEPMCSNEPHKPARYVTYSQEQTLYYCKKCAILLASQGFSVMELNTGESMQMNPRKEEVDTFLSELEEGMSQLTKKRQSLNVDMNNAYTIYQEEEAKVEQYYGQFYQILDELKRRVIEELKEEYKASIQQTSGAVQKIDYALNDSKRMKDDIIESMSIILDESEQRYRPIMVNYQNNLKDHKSLNNFAQNEPVNMRRLDFKDPELACSALEEGLQISWEGKRMESSSQSDVPENPVEVVEIDEKFTKSSLKQIGNLFSSFDE